LLLTGGDAVADNQATKLTYVPIANIALGHLGEDNRISGPDEESKAARAVKRAWEATRQFILAEANWSFALRTIDLTERVADPDWPIALERKAFPLPADLVTFVEIVEPRRLEDGKDCFSIEGGPNGQEILCVDAGPITVRYVRDGQDIADPTRWPPAYIEAFAFRLAWQISDELGADKGRKDRALTASDRALKLAKRGNTHTKARRRESAGDWVRARRCGVERAPGVCN
jgi:hypothetical protein